MIISTKDISNAVRVMEPSLLSVYITLLNLATQEGYVLFSIAALKRSCNIVSDAHIRLLVARLVESGALRALRNPDVMAAFKREAQANRREVHYGAQITGWYVDDRGNVIEIFGSPKGEPATPFKGRASKEQVLSYLDNLRITAGQYYNADQNKRYSSRYIYTTRESDVSTREPGPESDEVKLPPDLHELIETLFGYSFSDKSRIESIRARLSVPVESSDGTKHPSPQEMYQTNKLYRQWLREKAFGRVNLDKNYTDKELEDILVGHCRNYFSVSGFLTWEAMTKYNRTVADAVKMTISSPPNVRYSEDGDAIAALVASLASPPLALPSGNTDPSSPLAEKK